MVLCGDLSPVGYAVFTLSKICPICDYTVDASWTDWMDVWRDSTKYEWDGRKFSVLTAYLHVVKIRFHYYRELLRGWLVSITDDVDLDIKSLRIGSYATFVFPFESSALFGLLRVMDRHKMHIRERRITIHDVPTWDNFQRGKFRLPHRSKWTIRTSRKIMLQFNCVLKPK